MKNKLDFSENRNIFMPTHNMKKCLLKILKKVFEYPDYTNKRVNESISYYFDVPYDNLTITNGSMEAINLLLKVLNKNNATIFKPTFWGYEDALIRNNYKINLYNLSENLKYDLETISKKAKETEILFICNPNNPTLDYIDKKNLIDIIDNNPNCHFIIDETMLIFDSDFFDKSLCKNVSKMQNLSVIISFSKFLGIAGLRTGAVFSNRNVIKDIKKTMVPYSFGIIQQEIIPNAFSNKKYLEQTKVLIKKNKDSLCKSLRKIGCFVIDSNTNFILVKLPFGTDSNKITNFLSNDNIIIRNIKEAYPELDGDWIRISINSKKNNDILVKKINIFFQKNGISINAKNK